MSAVPSPPGYPYQAFRRVVAERVAGGPVPVPEAFLAVAEALAAWRGTGPLFFAGDPPRRIELSVASLRAYVEHVDAERARGRAEILCLADRPDDPELTLFLAEEAMSFGTVERFWASLPADAGPGQIGAASAVGRLVADVGARCGAYRACVEDERLLMLYRGRRATERARENLPDELRALVPEPPAAEGPARVIPSLLVPQEFDVRRVADAVWWINYWDAALVETAGRARVNSAGWARVEELPGGALSLTATDEPTDPEDPGHAETLARIVSHLGLRELQEQFPC